MPEGLSAKGRVAAEAILTLLKRDEATHTGGCKMFYSPEEWKARGEAYGIGSLLIVCHDGGDHAGYFNWDYENYEAVAAMNAALGAVGCYVESCTCWYSAIYPI